LLCQGLQRNLAFSIDVGLPRLKRNNMAWDRQELGGIFNYHGAKLGRFRKHGPEQRGLATSRSASNQKILPRLEDFKELSPLYFIEHTQFAQSIEAGET
jgi:hypothetical protein